MTKRLYDLDSHQITAESTVLSCAAAGEQFDVVLDQTVFFPEGGGQPSDTGTLGAANVLHVREEEGEIYHRLDRALAVGSNVTGTIDWTRRFDLMQQHTGEHLLSFSFYDLFAASNVGFHLALDYATIDFDKPVSREEIAEAELLANRFVWKNLPVQATFYTSEEEVAALPLRKHAEGLVPPIRIVHVEGADMCTCCAPHCHTTGEIGSVFVADASSYKGGTRITFYAGERALRLHRAQHDDLDAIARRFSCQREAALGAVKKLSDDYGALKKNERELAKSLNGYISAEFLQAASAAGKYRVVAQMVSGVDCSFIGRSGTAGDAPHETCQPLRDHGVAILRHRPAPALRPQPGDGGGGPAERADHRPGARGGRPRATLPHSPGCCGCVIWRGR
ncbi:MAG: alanyl-tRNA editing protein [Alphaproteobacteria bacterium]|nr:alanyl-tRNA editing protein [Alphaproteobacteria bacterium]